MSFESDMQAFMTKLLKRYSQIYVRCTMEVQRSVVEGSEVTGAPGQPVQSGNLKGSWPAGTRFVSRWEWELLTNVHYAPDIEDGVRKDTGRSLTLRSPVGGFHSVKMTRAGWQRIADYVVAQVVV